MITRIKRIPRMTFDWEGRAYKRGRIKRKEMGVKREEVEEAEGLRRGQRGDLLLVEIEVGVDWTDKI